MESARVVTIVLVSPGDVAEERNIAEAAIHGLRRTAAKRGLTLDIRKWEDVRGGYSPDGVQDRIQQELNIEHCDLLIALFWKKYGAIDKPPYSRTATEVLTAMGAKRERGAPEVIAYFSQQSYVPTSKSELDEHGRVLEFKHELRAAGVLTKDFIRGDLSMIVTYDVLDFLDSVAGPRHYHLRCQISCIPNRVRPEGYTEGIGEIQIALAGILPDAGNELVSANVKVSFSTNITSRLMGDSAYDSAVIISERGILAKGYRPETGLEQHVILFSAIPLGYGGSRFDEVLTIKGILVDAEQFGIVSNLEVNILAGIEITVSGYATSTTTIARKLLPVAKLGLPLGFSMVRQASDKITLPAAEEVEVYTFLLRVEGAVSEVLKTQAQEGSNLGGDHGTVLAFALANLVEKTVVLATETDIQPGEIPTLKSRAVAMRTTRSGVPLGQINGVAGAAWDGQIAMFEVEDNLAAWELIRPIQTGGPDLVFGLAFLVPRGSPPALITIAEGLAPFFSTATAKQPSRTLPVPRFIPGVFQQNLLLG